MKRFIKKHTLTLSLLAGIAATFAIASFTAFAQESERLPDEILRLHIMAESNSAEDQEFKLAVRDFVLTNFAEEFSENSRLGESPQTLSAVLAAAQGLLPEMQEALNQFALANGVSSPIRVELTEMFFTTRKYEPEFGGFTLPAGTYSALRIIIGEGEGDNWWCVMFPMLCLPAVSEPPAQSVFAPESGSAPAASDKPEIKFAIFEAFSRWFS